MRVSSQLEHAYCENTHSRRGGRNHFYFISKCNSYHARSVVLFEAMHHCEAGFDVACSFQLS